MKIIHSILAAGFLLTATNVQAARTLTLTFEAEGTGQRQSGFGPNLTPILAPIISAKLSYVVTEQSGWPNTYYFPSDTFFRFDGNGVSFAASQSGQLGFFATGKACYNNYGVVAGTYNVDPACSTLSYNSVGLVGFHERFTGNITRFTIAEGNTLANGGIYERVSVIPEPKAWLLMLAGFALLGGAMRYQRRNTRISFV